jgi:hypothetical protein
MSDVQIQEFRDQIQACSRIQVGAIDSWGRIQGVVRQP